MCHFALTRSVIQYNFFLSVFRQIVWFLMFQTNAGCTGHLVAREMLSPLNPFAIYPLWSSFIRIRIVRRSSGVTSLHLPYQIHHNNFSGSVFSVQLVMGVHSYYGQMIRWSNWNSTPLLSCPISKRSEETRIVEQWIKTEKNYYLEVDMYQ